MKKLLTIMLMTIAIITLSACEGSEETETTEATEATDAVVAESHDNIIPFDHLDGYGHEQERDAYILFEYRMRDYVKYQIAYLACTCRASEVNYSQVAYVEVGLNDNEIQNISYGEDGTGKYTAGFWGDSDPIPPYGDYTASKSDWIKQDKFEETLIPWLEGQTLETLNGISILTNAEYPGGHQNTATIDDQDMIDSLAGASVTSNNMIRVMKSLLEYHTDKYSE